MKNQFMALPPSMKIFFLSYLFLPLLALFGPGNPFADLLRLESSRVLVLMAAYYVLPWFICFYLMRRSPIMLPILLVQLGSVCADVFLSTKSFDDNMQVSRFVLWAILIVIGLLFTSRDVLFPLIATTKRGFRKAPRIYTNKSAAVVTPAGLIPVVLENCSLTGLAVFGESTQLAEFLKKRRSGQLFSICLDRKTPANTIMATLIAERSDGSHVRLGLSVNDTAKMSAFMASLMTKDLSLRWRLHILWNSSYFQRIAMSAWVSALIASVMLPAFQDGRASSHGNIDYAAIQEKEEDRPRGDLEVNVQGFVSDSGRLRLVIDNSFEAYLGNGFLFVDAPITNGQSKYVFRNLPHGQYAIRLFHDENDNGKLDTNLLGIPSEPYGFSNDARALFGAPNFENAKFDFTSRSSTISIRVKNHL